MKRTVPITEVLDSNELLAALIAFKKGDFSVRLPVNQVGLTGKITDSLNDIFELNENMAAELARQHGGWERRKDRSTRRRSRRGGLEIVRGIRKQSHYRSGSAQG